MPDESTVLVRIATETDARILAKLRYEFRVSLAEASEEETKFFERCIPWMQERLGSNSAWKCWIAEAEQTPIGNLWIQLIEKIPNPILEPEYHVYLTNFYVAEAWRSKGVGAMLLKAALQWIQSANVHSVFLWPTERSRAFYFGHGFSVAKNLMELVIGKVG